MGRGRKASVSNERLLLEILLNRDRAVFAVEIASNVPVSKERVRQMLAELEEGGYVEKNKISGRNLYRLTDAGFRFLSTELREQID